MIFAFSFYCLLSISEMTRVHKKHSGYIWKCQKTESEILVVKSLMNLSVSQSLPQISKMTCTLLSNLISKKWCQIPPSYSFVYFRPHETSSITICVLLYIGQYFCYEMQRIMPENYSSDFLAFIDVFFFTFIIIDSKIKRKTYGKCWTSIHYSPDNEDLDYMRLKLYDIVLLIHFLLCN